MVKGHKAKKNASTGAQSAYMTRTQAIKRLQITLKDFRKLCILKGIFPRDPQKKTKLKGKDKTYYYSKDISFLAHDPILSIFRQYKTWRKKITKARAKKEEETVKRLKANKPTYTLDHVVRERYPTFVDAVRDLDDALCMVNLFAALPQTDKIKPGRVENCNRLVKEFGSYVIASRSLRKVFLSIKGIYYQAEVMGQTITWLVPYQFTHQMPKDVDFRVLLTFLEFYETLLGFVNFKLFHGLGYHYPPFIDSYKDSHGDQLGAVILQSKDSATPLLSSSSSSSKKQTNTTPSKETKARISTLKSKIAQLKNKGADAEDTEEETNNDVEITEKEMKEVFEEDPNDEASGEDDFLNLFSKCKFFLGREVLKSSLEFVILCFGGSVSWEGKPDGFKEADETITHHIVDRSVIPAIINGRDYLQPQYVYDCINARVLLPTEDYLPNAKLPPHLSPFVDDAKEGYIPAQRERLNRMIAAARGIMEDKEGDKKEGEEDEGDEDDEMEMRDEDDEDAEEAARLEEQYEKEMDAEASGVSYSNFQGGKASKSKTPTATTTTTTRTTKGGDKKKKQQEKRKAEEQKEKEFAEMMIPSKKKKRLYQRIQYTENKKQQQNDTLLKKRKLIEETESSKQKTKQK